jgi:ligand-binding SRPBCC domain-containing protein
MPLIYLETYVRAPRERVFDLARSIDAHQDTAASTQEKAVQGVISGLLGAGEEVTWEARHFWVKQRLTVKMTRFEPPHSFQDVMLRGAFSEMRHDHLFEEADSGTLMIDRFYYTAPLGILGRLAEVLFLTRYMRAFLAERNSILKKTAESGEWRKYLEKNPDPFGPSTY